MKKFLSVVFMALCGITAIHAGNPQMDSRENVECEQTVTMTATPKPHYHFTQWVMTDKDNNVYTYTVAGSNSDYTCATDANGVNRLSIVMSSTMIAAAINNEIIFEAQFDEDGKYTVTGVAVNNDANYTPNTAAGTITITHNGTTTQDSYTGYENDNITLTATPDDCYKFVKWIDATGTTVSSTESFNTTVTASANTVYRAVFEKKTVKVTAKSADQDKGTVQIVVPASSN